MRGPALRPIACGALAAASLQIAPARAQPAPGDGGARPPPPVVEDIEVRGTKPEPAPKTSVDGREVRQIPGAFGDAFRALETLPGVTPIASGVPYFYVRGAPPGNTGYFIDGVRVPGLFHLGVGPAVLYPALVDKVELHRGGYPARFGRFSGGIVSADIVPPATRPRADWTLRLFDAGALVEAPFAPFPSKNADPGVEPKGSALVSGRYGYPGLLLSLFAPDASLAYWDYQTRVTYKVSPRDTLSVLSFGSFDSISERKKSTGELEQILGIQFHRVDLRWDRQTSKTGSLRTAITVGYDRTAGGPFAITADVLGARSEWREKLSDDARIHVGADVWLRHYGLTTEQDDVVEPIGSEPDAAPRGPQGGGAVRTGSRTQSALQDDVNMGMYVDVPLRLAPHVQAMPGLRLDAFTSRTVGSGADTYDDFATSSAPSIAAQNARAIVTADPRLSTRIGLGPVTHIAAIGIAHQPSALPFPLPALTLSQLWRGVQRGHQLSQGFEIPLPWDLTANVTGFLHAYTGLVDLGLPCDFEEDNARCGDGTTRGRAYGLEMMLGRKLTKRVGGWISYTLSRSTRDTYDPFGRRYVTVLSQFDRTHVLNVVGSVDLGRGWRFGARYVGYSGIPYSTLYENGVPNARGPAFHRIDARLEKRWIQRDGRYVAVTAEMFNVLVQKEAIGTTCPSGGFDCEPQLIGPIAIPSLGVEGTL